LGSKGISGFVLGVFVCARSCVIREPSNRDACLELEFLADTGAMYTSLPESLLKRLEIVPLIDSIKYRGYQCRYPEKVKSEEVNNVHNDKP